MWLIRNNHFYFPRSFDICNILHVFTLMLGGYNFFLNMQACLSWFFHLFFKTIINFCYVLSSFFPTLSQFVFNWFLGFSYTKQLYKNYFLTYSSKFKLPTQKQRIFDIKLAKARIPMYMLYLKMSYCSHFFHFISLVSWILKLF